MNDEASALHADPARAFDGQYQLGDEIGAGALGVVYRGVDEKLDKSVAIKVWHARLEDETPLREQYDVEARALTALDHPNVVAITDYGIAGQAPYLVMELLDGQTLGARMRQGALPASVTQTIMQSVLRGLGYMHMRGVVHRNLKPDNVFLHKLDADSEQLKLLDLGLESLPANTNTNTNADAVQERPTAYDAPEHDAGTEPDGRSDVYAAGVMMLHMLSGREPTRELVRAAADSADLLQTLLPTATPEVRAFIARAIAPARGNRFGNADQMLRALLELSMPWAGDPPGAVAAPPQTPAASIKPQLEPAHAQLEAAATTLLQGDTVELPAADSGDDVELGPIGLMAKLRAHKRLLWLSGGAVGLAAIGVVVALTLGQSATNEHEPEPNAAQQPEAKSTKVAQAEHADEKAQEQEEQQPILKREEPTPEKYAARLGDGEPEATPPSEETSEPSAAPDSAVQPALEQTKATGHGAGAPAPPVKVAAEASAQAKAHADDNPYEHVVPSAAAEPSAATSGKTEAHPAAAAEPKAPTPEQIGSERHIEPDKSEIRKMLALAIAPKPRVPAKDPWNIEVPGSLQALRDAIAKGERGSAGNLRTLRHYSSENPDDVYGHLLLAGFYANRGFSLDALDQYDMAYRIDTSSRGAPEMLKHALTMVVRGIAESDAARFIDRVYGREALAAISQLTKARDTSPAAARRLRQLQARIGAAKRR